jgi:hypothetical protein
MKRLERRLLACMSGVFYRSQAFDYLKVKGKINISILRKLVECQTFFRAKSALMQAGNLRSRLYAPILSRLRF